MLMAIVLFSPGVRAQISPGPLSQAHQFLSGPTQCSSCHETGQGSAILRCQQCHTEIAEELAQHRGLHSKFSNGDHCAQCHSEHNGEDFHLIHWVPSLKGFDHNQTGYALQGKHRVLECSQCHNPSHILPSEKPLIKMKDLRNTFLGLSQSCATCHEDPHKGGLGQNCLQCHDFNDWKSSKIDHSKTRFPLTGLHAQVPCSKCHTAASAGGAPRFTGIPFAKCSDCHADPHHGSFAQACESCHTTAGWKKLLPKIEFDHSKTTFPLLGKHASVDCLACHVGGNFKKPVAFAKCGDCHQDPHGGQFADRLDKGECSSCHTVNGWKPSTFDVKAHASTAYPLKGNHAQVPCARCHVPAGTATRYKIAFANCTDCHKDPHAGQFAGPPHANRCEDCHTVEGFRPSTYTIAEHQKTRFPLRGAHMAVICSDCHNAAKFGRDKVAPYRFNDRTCTGCHTDPHQGQFRLEMARLNAAGSPAGCEACHSVNSWTDLPGFDHSKTAFPLTGAHKRLRCEQCHKPATADGKLSAVSFKSTPTACAVCHEDIHAGQFARGGQAENCDRCHNTAAWKPSLFNHETQTNFSLKGAHLKVKCDECHKSFRLVEGKEVLFYSPTPRECASCHD